MKKKDPQTKLWCASGFYHWSVCKVHFLVFHMNIVYGILVYSMHYHAQKLYD